MMKKQDLLEKKLHIERFRQSSSLSPLHAQQIQQSILNSWQRSEIAEIPVDRLAAPLNSSLSHPQGGSALQTSCAKLRRRFKTYRAAVRHGGSRGRCGQYDYLDGSERSNA